ncbi:hypothetical protein F5884DRAFT_756286 [Xylogone sp. PMI_703]|nr:hypothetical protein F5884DRAFT_756286 [Xylogone sp. PMI_703]
MWLRDFLLSQLDEIGVRARIWSYGYNSKTAFSAVVSDITDEAGMLLDRCWFIPARAYHVHESRSPYRNYSITSCHALWECTDNRVEGERVTTEEKSRRVIFIAHSLGGILVKKVYESLWNNSQLVTGFVGNDYCTRTIKTLWKAAVPVIWNRVPWYPPIEVLTWLSAADLLKAVQLGRGTNTTYVEALKRNLAESSHISQQWVERSEDVHICIFNKTERSHGILVVDKVSARLGLPNEIAVGLAGSNHRTIWDGG